MKFYPCPHYDTETVNFQRIQSEILMNRFRMLKASFRSITSDKSFFDPVKIKLPLNEKKNNRHALYSYQCFFS